MTGNHTGFSCRYNLREKILKAAVVDNLPIESCLRHRNMQKYADSIKATQAHTLGFPSRYITALQTRSEHAHSRTQSASYILMCTHACQTVQSEMNTMGKTYNEAHLYSNGTTCTHTPSHTHTQIHTQTHTLTRAIRTYPLALARSSRHVYNAFPLAQRRQDAK